MNGDRVVQLSERFIEFDQLGFMPFIMIESEETGPIKWGGPMTRVSVEFLEDSFVDPEKMALERCFEGYDYAAAEHARLVRLPAWR